MPSIQTLRGAPVEPETAEAVRAFWREHGGPEGATAEERLAQVVCVLREEDGRVLGVNSVFASEVPLVRRTFWVYRSLLAPEASGEHDGMISAAFAALNGAFTGARDEPLGLCLLIADRQEMARRPELLWDDPRMLYVGYLDDGRQVRVAYFDDARVGPGLDDG